MMEQKEESEEEREKEKAKNRHRSIISYRSRWEQKEDDQETASQRMRSPIAARIWVQIFCCHDVVAHKAAAVRSLITSLQTLLRSLRREPASRGTPRRLAASSTEPPGTMVRRSLCITTCGARPGQVLT